MTTEVYKTGKIQIWNILKSKIVNNYDIIASPFQKACFPHEIDH